MTGITAALSAQGCGDSAADAEARETKDMDTSARLDQYTSFRLESDLSGLSENERNMLPLLIDAARVMDGLFWRQSYGDREELMGRIKDADQQRLVEINYGPWDRLAGDEPFVPGIAAKPEGARFYPEGMTKEEFEAAAAPTSAKGAALRNQYTFVRRDDGGNLSTEPYHEVFAAELEKAAGKLREAALLAEDPGLKKYLELRAKALVTDDYQPSDLAWMDMKDNTIDVVIGAIETYEDALFGYKATYEAYVLIKDKEWSGRLTRYVALLPDLQRGLPVPEQYKQETPGTESDLNAYDVIYYAGDCNAGAKTIAINLPNDEEVQLQKGTRRLQLKNAMRAKFEKILVPIGDLLIAEDQRPYIDFDAFFENTMFHEVAHGLGIKNTLTGEGSVREALKDKASALEEGKADILGLYMVTKLHEQGELEDSELMDNYVTFLAGIFRSIRFGASSAHGIANLLRFNFFAEAGAFSRDEATGTYRVEMDEMQQAVDALSAKILTLQGDGDYDGVSKFVEDMGVIGDGLQVDLDRLSTAGIPVDVVFEQGLTTGWP
jgi:hypothetical protein